MVIYGPKIVHEPHHDFMDYICALQLVLTYGAHVIIDKSISDHICRSISGPMCHNPKSRPCAGVGGGGSGDWDCQPRRVLELCVVVAFLRFEL